MDPLSRRHVLALGAAGTALAATAASAATFGNPDRPGEGAVNASAAAARDPGPQNAAIAGQFPDAQLPPPSDIGEFPQFWASFNNAHRRIQAGGWARQVTQADFQISDAVSGVNMRLAAGGIRELHWHQASEWAVMTYGRCRVTVLDPQGRAYVDDVEAGDLWFFPAGYPHSLQGLGPDGCEFVIVFDDGKASEFNTLLLTDWLAHTPPEVLAKNFGMPAAAFGSIPLDDLWIFQGKEPGPLAEDRAAVRSGGQPPNPFTFRLADLAPIRSNRSGSLKVTDSKVFKVSDTIAAALETIKPGGLREMHWHPNADEWQYYIEGTARMGVFASSGQARTFDFMPGDVGFVPFAMGHYVENTGNTTLRFLEIFKSSYYADLSLNQWLALSPPELVDAHLHLDPKVAAAFRKMKAPVVPV
jgi:oxalate decarboxylase